MIRNGCTAASECIVPPTSDLDLNTSTRTSEIYMNYHQYAIVKPQRLVELGPCLQRCNLEVKRRKIAYI